MISNLFQRDYDRDLRDDLYEAVRAELADRPPEKSSWMSWLGKLVRFTRVSRIEYEWLMIGTLIAFVLIPSGTITVLSISKIQTPASSLADDELRFLISFAPSLCFGLLGFFAACFPLSSRRGKRNAVFPAWDDSRLHWMTAVTSLFFAGITVASLCFLRITIASCVVVPIAPAIMFSVLNGLLLTSLVTCVVRIAPPTYEDGRVELVLVCIFLVPVSTAIATNGIAMGGLFKFLAIAVSPTVWVSNLFFEVYVAKNSIAYLLLVPIFATIWFGLRSLSAISNSQPQLNYFENQIEKKIHEVSRRKSARERIEKFQFFQKPKSSEVNNDATYLEYVNERLDLFEQEPLSLRQQFRAWMLGKRMWQLSSKRVIAPEVFKIKIQRPLLLIIGFVILFWFAYCANNQWLLHGILGLFEGVLIGACTVHSAAYLTGGACPRRYPLGYWQVLFGSLKLTAMNLLIAAPIYLVYLFALNCLDPLTAQELGSHVFTIVWVWLLFAGVVMPIGFPVSSVTVRLALTWLYSVGGTVIFMMPAWVALHLYIAKVARDTPPGVLEQNMGMFAHMGHPWALWSMLVLVATAGIAHFIGYTIVYLFCQRDFHAAATTYFPNAKIR